MVTLTKDAFTAALSSLDELWFIFPLGVWADVRWGPKQPHREPFPEVVSLWFQNLEGFACGANMIQS